MKELTLHRHFAHDAGGAPSPRVALIRAAALRHFALHGYDAASMRQIAAAAGITIATLYFHCSTKEKLLFDVLEAQMQALSEGLDAVLERAADSWSARLASAIRFHIQNVTRDEESANISTSELRRLTGDFVRATSQPVTLTSGSFGTS